MSGQQIGSVVGGIVGSFIPGVGTQLGIVIGGIIGGAIDPTKVYGPRLSDGMQVTASDGIPNPWGFGAFPIGGNVIWAAELVEHKHTDDGKGSGVEQVTYSYSRSYAIGICRANRNYDGTYADIAGIVRATRNGKVVYDTTPDADAEQQSLNAKFLNTYKFYLGGEGQNPDPTIESYLGVGNASAYRGQVYMVATDEDETDSSGAIPQWEFVVAMAGSGDVTSSGIYWSTEDRTSTDRGEILLSNGTKDAQGVRYDPENDPPFWAGVRGRTGRSSGRYCIELQIISDDSSLSGSVGLANEVADLNSTMFATPNTMSHNFVDGWAISGTNSVYPSAPVSTGSKVLIAADLSLRIGWIRVDGLWMGGQDPASTPGGLSGLTIPDGELFPFFSIGPGTSATTKVRMVTASADITDMPDGFLAWGFSGIPVPGAPGVYMMPDGQLFVDGDTPTLEWNDVTLGQIVSECCRRCGLESGDFDVSQLTDTLHGFRVASESSGEQIIGSLMPAFFFDAMEVDDVLTFVKRGGDVVAELTVDDLLERDDGVIEEIEAQEVELLRKVNVQAMDPEAGWVETTQSAERRSSQVNATGEQSIQLPIVINKDTQAQIAHKRMKVAWGEPRRFKFDIPYTRPELTPTDVIGLTDKNGHRQRVRLEEMSEDGGRIEVSEAHYDRQSSYTSSSTGVTKAPPTDTRPGLIGPTYFVPMNLPSLRTSDNVPGCYWSACGYLSGWRGAVIFMSIDGGTSYSQVAVAPTAGTMGSLTLGCTEDSEPITTFFNSGQPVSVTNDQIAAGLNAFAITTDGVSEIGQFGTATLASGTTYELTDTVRGGLGTVAAVHQVSDPFVMLSGAKFLPLDIGLAGKTLYFKAVSNGTSIDDAEAVPFVFQPLFTSVTVEAYTDDNGDPYTDDADNPYYYEMQA